jgi:hypothetical protein
VPQYGRSLRFGGLSPPLPLLEWGAPSTGAQPLLSSQPLFNGGVRRFHDVYHAQFHAFMIINARSIYECVHQIVQISAASAKGDDHGRGLAT